MQWYLVGLGLLVRVWCVFGMCLEEFLWVLVLCVVWYGYRYDIVWAGLVWLRWHAVV